MKYFTLFNEVACYLGLVQVPTIIFIVGQSNGD